jgi:hypothetical protein
MRVNPNITQTWVIMVMKTLVNFKAHNLKVVGSNPTPATKKPRFPAGFFAVGNAISQQTRPDHQGRGGFVASD